MLGQLSDQEKTVLENNLLRYPELRKELTRVEEAQEALLMQVAVEPQAHVINVIREKIESSSKESLQQATKSDIKVVEINRRNNVWQYAAAACVTLAVASSYFAYVYHSRWQRAEGELTTLIAQNARIAQDYNTVNNKLSEIETELNVISNPAFTRVLMKGTENAPQALASIYWNKNTKEVYLNVHALQQLTQDKQFQLWAIVDGKPVDAGVFNSQSGLVKMKSIANAAAFAVTIEPRGGSINPTLSTMQTLGNT